VEKVSIVVATYNQAAYLPICLDSIYFQDHPDIEIVVVNDGSTDDTVQALEAYQHAVATETTSYAARYDEAAGRVERRIHHRYPQTGRSLQVIHQKNQGLSVALNVGTQAATGRFVTFIASDDMLLPSMAATLLAAIRDNDADFAYADMHIVDDTGRILRRFALPDYSFQAAFCDWYLCGVCKLYKKSLHDVSGYFDPACVSQDHDMYLRFAMDGARFVHVPRVLANVRIHDKDRKVDNHSPDKETRQFSDSMRLVRTARAFARERGGA
jgi:glycosyltransferase involved in cell wall biosynthesis